MADEAKSTYKVKEGCRFGSANELGPGDTVELTEAEAAGFLDKLEKVEKVEPKAPAVPKKPAAGE